jgi:hypothetical protein
MMVYLISFSIPTRSHTQPIATSNAPTIGRKRRLSNDEDDDVQDVGSTRKRRGQIERRDTSELGELRVKGGETDIAVKEVTRGVKKVELEDKREGSTADEAKDTTTEASQLAEGKSSATPPLDPSQVPQKDGGSSGDATVTDDKTPVDESETIAETSTTDLVEVPVEKPKSADVTEPLVQLDVDEETEQSDAAPAASSDVVVHATESTAIP